ncbi:MAG TPA: prolipoprotein diacylglyceryl transferase family protein [Silvibacterium sp.]|nr:prolipoprotein diacylglyceryl transferase family protein [Silvibacterium sp.]
MRRVLFRWRGLTVWSYPALLYVGLLCGVLAAMIAARAAGISPLRTYVATILLLIPALAGARLLWIASHWTYCRTHPRDIWNRRQGGFMMYGGLPFALLVSIPLLRALRLNFGTFWDVSTYTILVGMMFTRVGCLLNGCCSGRHTSSWIGLNLPNHEGIREKRIPNQLLEGLCAAGLLTLVTAIWGRTPFPGAVFLVVVLGYSGTRFAMEFLRDREPHVARFTVGHGAASAALLASVIILALRWPR